MYIISSIIYIYNYIYNVINMCICRYMIYVCISMQHHLLVPCAISQFPWSGVNK